LTNISSDSLISVESRIAGWRRACVRSRGGAPPVGGRRWWSAGARQPEPGRRSFRSGHGGDGPARPVPVSWLAQVERAPEADVMSFIDRRRTPVSQIGNDETEPATEVQCVSATRRLADAFRHAYRRITLL